MTQRPSGLLASNDGKRSASRRNRAAVASCLTLLVAFAACSSSTPPTYLVPPAGSYQSYPTLRGEQINIGFGLTPSAGGYTGVVHVHPMGRGVTVTTHYEQPVTFTEMASDTGGVGLRGSAQFGGELGTVNFSGTLTNAQFVYSFSSTVSGTTSESSGVATYVEPFVASPTAPPYFPAASQSGQSSVESKKASTGSSNVVGITLTSNAFACAQTANDYYGWQSWAPYNQSPGSITNGVSYSSASLSAFEPQNYTWLLGGLHFFGQIEGPGFVGQHNGPSALPILVEISDGVYFAGDIWLTTFLGAPFSYDYSTTTNTGGMLVNSGNNNSTTCAASAPYVYTGAYP